MSSLIIIPNSLTNNGFKDKNQYLRFSNPNQRQEIDVILSSTGNRQKANCYLFWW